MSKSEQKAKKIFGFLLTYSYLFALQEGTSVRKSQKYLAFCSLIRTFATPLEESPIVRRGTGGKINCIEI
jgi:hypothetical protein